MSTYEVLISIMDAASTGIAGLVVHGEASVLKVSFFQIFGLVRGTSEVEREGAITAMRAGATTQASASVTALGGIMRVCSNKGGRERECECEGRKDGELCEHIEQLDLMCFFW